MEDYIFGLKGNNEALNQILLELKVFNFYNLQENPNTSNETFQKTFLSRIKKLILKEKDIAILGNKYDEFEYKWDKYLLIYDYRGPNVDFIT